MKNKQDIIRIEEDLKKLPLCKLIIFTSEVEKHILELKKQGLQTKNRNLRKRMWVRGAYRRILLEKLNKWKDGEDVDKMDFASAQNELNLILDDREGK